MGENTRETITSHHLSFATSYLPPFDSSTGSPQASSGQTFLLATSHFPLLLPLTQFFSPGSKLIEILQKWQWENRVSSGGNQSSKLQNSAVVSEKLQVASEELQGVSENNRFTTLHTCHPSTGSGQASHLLLLRSLKIMPALRENQAAAFDSGSAET